MATLKERHPELIFLAEAFTRPKMMTGLAKVGFSLSYTYFAWRTTKAELTEYVQSWSTATCRILSPSFWPNTPDILPEHLQLGTPRDLHCARGPGRDAVPKLGIYGPPFELQEQKARPGARSTRATRSTSCGSWDLRRPHSLRPVLRRLNQIRRDNPAHCNAWTARSFTRPTTTCSSVTAGDASSTATPAVLVVVNLDPHNRPRRVAVARLERAGAVAGRGDSRSTT